MRFLMCSDFVAESNSGAAGTILATGRALEEAHHEVDYIWHEVRPAHKPHATLHRWVALPRHQHRQVAARLARAAFDVVIVSQPSAYLVYERLQSRYPTTLFLNRTHGWEARLYEAQLRHRWGPTGTSRGMLATQVGAMFARRACQRTARSCHGVVAASAACTAFVRARYPIAPERVATISHGVDDDLLDQPIATRSGPPRVLFVGNYLPLKGRDVLREVLPAVAGRHPTVHTEFLVDRDSVESVRTDFASHFGSRLHVQSWVSRTALTSVYDRADILLFPSLFEGFGKVWLEAMARGVCVVGFPEGGLPDVATDGVHAYLAATGDARSLRSALDRALGDIDETRHTGRRARSAVSGRTWTRAARELVEFVERLRATS